jgi:hypothetical protein
LGFEIADENESAVFSGYFAFGVVFRQSILKNLKTPAGPFPIELREKPELGIRINRFVSFLF